MQHSPDSFIVDKTKLLLSTPADVRLIAVIAPAGYGKSTLLSQWCRKLEQAAHRVVWVSLHQGVLVTEVADALEQCLGLTASTAGHREEERSVRTVLHRAARSGTFTLFADGLDSLPQQQRDWLAGEIFDALPPRCRLALGSRAELPERFSLMFVNGTAMKLTAAELRFDESETRLYLGQEFPRDSIADVSYLSEGWPVGLRQIRELAARDPGKHTSRAEISEAMCRDDTLNTYFSNVLRQQPEQIRSLVARLSILEEMSAELVRSLTESSAATARFETLQRESLFIEASDGHRQWFRFHRLFAAWLRHHQALRDSSDTCTRTIDWLFRNGHYLQAQPYLAAVGSTDFIAQLLISSGGLSLMFRGGPAVTRFLQSLPLAVVQANPALELARIYRLVQSGELGLARRNFEDLKVRMGDFAVASDSFAPTAADGVVMELLLSLYEDRTLGPQALINAEASLGIDQAGNAIRPAVVRELLSWSFYHAGNFHRARTIGRESIDLCLRVGIPYVQIYAYLAIGLAELAEGHVNEAADIYALAEAEATRHFGSECNQVMAAQILGAEILYARNQVATARDVTAHWSEAVAHGDGWVDLHASLYRTLTSALRALGDSSAALAVLEQAKHMARERKLWRLEQILENHQLREACLAGELALAGRIAATLQDEHPRSVSLQHQGWRVWFTRLLALARHALERHDLTACAVALQDIDRQVRTGAGNHSLLLLERDLLEARMLFESDDDRYARPLTRAMNRAAKARLLRPILDEGSTMLAIVRQYIASCSPPSDLLSFLREVLEEAPRAAIAVTGRPGVASEVSGPSIGEPLSKREVEVLALICEGLTSKEIARRLSISVNTVLTYRKNLYRKLCASTRSQLITITREQRILKPAATPLP